MDKCPPLEITRPHRIMRLAASSGRPTPPPENFTFPLISDGVWMPQPVGCPSSLPAASSGSLEPDRHEAACKLKSMFLPLAFQGEAEWKFISISKGESTPRVPAAPRRLTNPMRAHFQFERFVVSPRVPLSRVLISRLLNCYTKSSVSRCYSESA